MLTTKISTTISPTLSRIMRSKHNNTIVGAITSTSFKYEPSYTAKFNRQGFCTLVRVSPNKINSFKISKRHFSINPEDFRYIEEKEMLERINAGKAEYTKKLRADQEAFFNKVQNATSEDEPEDFGELKHSFPIIGNFVDKFGHFQGEEWYRSLGSETSARLYRAPLCDRLHNSRIPGIQLLNGILRQPGLTSEVRERKIENALIPSISEAINRTQKLTNHHKFDAHRKIIDAFFSLESRDSWVSHMANHLDIDIRVTKDLEKTYQQLCSIEAITHLRRPNEKQWGTMIFNSILQTCQGGIEISDTWFSDYAVKSPLPTTDTYTEKAQVVSEVIKEFKETIYPKVDRRKLIKSTIEDIENWYRENTRGIVLDIVRHIGQLEDMSDKIYRNGAPSLKMGQELFLLQFTSYRNECRKRWAEKQATPEISVEEILASDFIASLNPEDYNADIEHDFKPTDTSAPLPIAGLPNWMSRALAIPEILSYVAYIYDMKTVIPPSVVSSTEEYLFHECIPKLKLTDNNTMMKLIHVIIEEIGIFESETIQEVHDGKVKTLVTVSFTADIWNIVARYGMFHDTKIMMVTKPNPYTLARDRSTIYGGGFLNNVEKGVPGMSSKNGDSTANVAPLLVETINKLQEQPFKIDGDMLRALLNDYDTGLKNYLISMDSLEEYPLLIEEIFEAKGKCHSELIHKALLKRHPGAPQSILDRKVAAIHRSIYLGMSDYFSIITLAIEFYLYNKPVYMVFFLDHRYRLYALGLYLSLQGATVSKSLLVPAKTSDHDPHQYQHLATVKYVKDRIMERDTGKHYFPNLSLKVHNGVLKYISIDVSSSGSQIYAAMAGNVEGLIATNFMKRVAEEPWREDMYGQIMFKFLNRLDATIAEYLDPLRMVGFTDEFHYQEVDKFRKLFSRGLAKEWIMCYAYSQGPKARIRRLSILSAKAGVFTHVPRPKLREVFAVFPKMFIKVLDELFPDIKSILQFYKSLVREDSSGHVFGSVGFHKGYYLEGDRALGYPLILHNRINEIRVRMFKSEIPGYTNYALTNYQRTGDYDPKRGAMAVAANATHNKDAALCFNLLIQCNLQGIYPIPSHDAFVCHVGDVQRVQEAYFTSVCALLLERDQFVSFLGLNKSQELHDTFFFELVNQKKLVSRHHYNLLIKEHGKSIIPPRSALNLMITSYWRRQDILDKLRGGDFIMSPYILS